MNESASEAAAIVGYRKLSPDEIALMNEGKALAEQCGAFIDKVGSHHMIVADPRWLSIGKTDLQKGWMAVIRAIAQPTTF